MNGHTTLLRGLTHVGGVPQPYWKGDLPSTWLLTTYKLTYKSCNDPPSNTAIILGSNLTWGFFVRHPPSFLQVSIPTKFAFGCKTQTKNDFPKSVGFSSGEKKKKLHLAPDLPSIFVWFRNHENITPTQQDGPLPVINGVITPINGLING